MRMAVATATAIAYLSIVGVSVAADVEAAAKRHTDIPAQGLGPALRSLAKDRGFQIVFASKDVSELRTQGASGEFTVGEALAQILSGTGLTYRYLDDQTITVAPLASISLETDGAAQDHSSLSVAGTSLEPVDRGSESLATADAREDVKGTKESFWSKRRLAQSSSSRTATNEQGRDGSAGAAAAGSDADLEEVIVTARKTSERLQDVPISVSALTGDQLRELGAVDVKDVLGRVPGLAFQGVERGLSKYNIRGISTNVESPTVGVYLDDISLVTFAVSGYFTGAYDPIFFDTERLEVLKGPQGTLYGGSSMGGAIKYVSTRPDLSALSSSVAGGVAMTDEGEESYNAEGIVNLPLIPGVLAVRGGLLYRRDGGYIDNVANGDMEYASFSSTPSPVYTPLTQPSLTTLDQDDQNSGEAYAARLSLLWQPDPSWSIRPAVFYQDYKLANNSSFFTNQDGLTSSWRVKQPTHDRGGIYSLDINKDWGAVQLTSLTGYFDRKLDWYRDYSYFVGGLVSALYPLDSRMHAPTNTSTFSQELRIASAAGPEARLKWLAGLYYSDQDDEFKPYLTDFGATPVLGTELGYFSEAVTNMKQYAAFGEATYALTDRLDLTAGVRLFRIEQDYEQWADGPFTGGRQEVNGSSKDDGVNPKVGLSYKATPDNLLYASAAKGFRPGGVNREVVPANLCAVDLAELGYSAAPPTFDFDNLWSYELGSKNQFGGGRAVVNGALFHTDWKKIQQDVSLPGCGFNFTGNAGTARIQGAELETRFSVTPAFQLGATATFTDAKIVETSFGTRAQDGDEIQAVPEWMASAYTSYSLPVNAAWELQVRADYQYRSKARTSFDRLRAVTFSDSVTGLLPNETEFEESYQVVNLNGSITNGTTTVRLYANNVLNEQPYLFRELGFAVASSSATLRPRTIGLELRQQF